MLAGLRKQLLLLLLIGLLVTAGVLFSTTDVNLPGNHQGYAPEQPIAFSHRLHSGELDMDCLYCHSGVGRSRSAGIPTADTCMNCHRFVTKGWDDSTDTPSLELAKLYAGVGYDPQMFAYQEDSPQAAVEWVRVHRLPDFVSFDHRPHFNAGVSCQTCHGPVQTMERVAQQADLSMGWCVNCHRDVEEGDYPELAGRTPSTDCGVCHY